MTKLLGAIRPYFAKPVQVSQHHAPMPHTPSQSRVTRPDKSQLAI